MDIFSLASVHSAWGAARQSVIAGNIAHADTPDFKAKDIAPFSAEVKAANLRMSTTHAGHIQPSGAAVAGHSSKADVPWEVSHSGNSVTLEQELIKSGEVQRALSLNHAIVKSFHRMMLSGLRTNG